jgi:hypothetical protein
MSARQLTSRPKEILPLEHQSHITDVDPRARNRSGRYGPMYLVEPRGTGAYVVAHSQWLERAAIATAVFAAYERRASRRDTAAGVQILFVDYVDTDPLRCRGVPQIPVPRTPAGTPPGTPPNGTLHPAATEPAPTGVWGVLQRVASRVTGRRVGATCELDYELEDSEGEKGSSSEEETEEEEKGTL